MKATELRIGNWFYSKCKGRNEWVDKHHFSASYIDGKDSYYLENCAEPIPLTEEWLQRFGWVKSKDRNYFWHDSNLTLWFNDNGLFIESFVGKLYIKHVHQLQNLYFALTGEELQTDESKKKVNQ